MTDEESQDNLICVLRSSMNGPQNYLFEFAIGFYANKINNLTSELKACKRKITELEKELIFQGC